MQQNRFRKTFLVLFVIAIGTLARGSTSWLPAKVLAMAYPREARGARIEGTVQARCSVRPDGSVEDVVITMGHPVLARSVKANLLRWTFRSNPSDNRSTVDAIVTFDFQLKGTCDEYNRCNEEYWYEYPDRVIVVSEMPRLNPAIGEAYEEEGKPASDRP